jgi:hypothetical protein
VDAPGQRCGAAAQGVVTIDHFEPFHRSASSPPPPVPTAWQLVLVAQVTAFRPFAPLRLGLAATDQFVPFQCSASVGPEEKPGGAAVPVAQQLLVLVHATLATPVLAGRPGRLGQDGQRPLRAVPVLCIGRALVLRSRYRASDGPAVQRADAGHIVQAVVSAVGEVSGGILSLDERSRIPALDTVRRHPSVGLPGARGAGATADTSRLAVLPRECAR